MSYSSNESQIIATMKRKEAAFSAFAKFVGVASAVALAAVISVTVYKKMHMKTRLEDDYLQSIYGKDGHGLRSKDSAEAQAERERYERTRAADLSRTGKNLPPPTEPVQVVDLSTNPRPAMPESQPVASGGVANIDAKQDAIAAVVKEFFEARSVAEILPLVRDARRVRPLLEEYYTRKKFDPPSWKAMGWAKSTMDPGYHFAYVQAQFNDRPPSFVLVEEVAGSFYVDWESAVHYCEQDWQDFQNKRPGEPKVFRVLASKSDLAASVSTNDQQVTIKLKHPQEDGVLYGSFDKSDPSFRPLIQQLDSCQWEKAPVILRLCYPGPSAAPNQVRIAGVEGKGWIILGREPQS